MRCSQVITALLVSQFSAVSERSAEAISSPPQQCQLFCASPGRPPLLSPCPGISTGAAFAG